MSTNNNAAQTLFRFVSLRNPKLTETKNKNFAFVQRPEGVVGIFDEAVQTRGSSAKQEAMASRVEEFNQAAYPSVEFLEGSEFAEMLKIGRKLSKREELKQEDWDLTRQFYDELTATDFEEKMSQLWDNFIFQVISQKNFYVKEAIAQILKAIHLGFVQNISVDEDIIKINGEEPLNNALNAKTVLPKELFSEALVTATTSGSTTLPPRTTQRLKVETDNLEKLNKAHAEKTALENLDKEISKLEKEYRISKESEYNEAYKAYMEEYGEQITEYERRLIEVENQITEEMPIEEQQALYDSLAEFEVPPFEFSYRNEINLNDLQTKLSVESFNLFLELFSDFDFEDQAKIDRLQEAEAVILSDRKMQLNDTTIQLDPSFQSLFEMSSRIQAHIASAAQTIIGETSTPQQQYVNIGGALIPTSSNSGSITHLAYSLKANWQRLLFLSNGRGNVVFSFEAENNSWNVASAKLTATTNQGQIVENFANLAVVNNKVSFPLMLVNKFTSISNFKLEIFFANGRTSVLELPNLINNNLYTGILTLNTIKDIIPETGEGGTEENGSTGARKNFGIKRLGIADYLKVVQSVHAYVPGEVSNIENVMASELRHKSSVAREYSEVTDTTSKSEETEKISDTTKTSRTDMQTEVAKELDKQQSITAHTRFTYDAKAYKFEIGADYANNTAQHDSTRQAVMKSQEITERALERVLTKISEERVQKIIKEYTETNVHEYDNRGSVTDTDNPEAARPQHITGVYRWIDKKMKNQIYNYGKRTMFEFMVPEPAKLHRLALTVAKAEQLTAPIDPRKSPTNTMANAKAATQQLLEHWAGVYGVSLSALPALFKVQNIGRQDFKLDGDGTTRNLPIIIDDNYAATSVKVMFGHNREKHHNTIFGGGNKSQTLYYSNFNGGMHSSTSRDTYVTYKEANFSGLNISGTYNYSFRGDNLDGCHFAFSINCKLSDSFLDAWKTESFNAIITAYEQAYKDFQDRQAALDAEQKAKADEAKEKQGNFYRYMEADVLKHNCIAYLLQDYLTVLGQDFTNGDKMENFEVVLSEKLDQYTALAKFMEQAFEWEIMDYTFYPYFWADRKMWQEMYVSESVDPLFRSFLQAGMARVIVTVKPGFEDAVQFFLETGLIWNGGEVPVIGDPMYMSIVDEMREPTGLPQGKYWITRIPTTLTILQDKSTGLPVDKPLPIFIENNPDNCENPLELETETSFEPRDIALGRISESV